jgi:hypothetical protein
MKKVLRVGEKRKSKLEPEAREVSNNQRTRVESKPALIPSGFRGCDLGGRAEPGGALPGPSCFVSLPA